MKKIIPCSFLILALAVGGCAGKKKAKYPMEEMPKSAYLTEPHRAEDLAGFDAAACLEVGPILGDAFQTLEALVRAGNRRTGSQEYRCAAEASRNTLAARGWDTEFQNYRFPYYQFSADSFGLVRNSDGKTFAAHPVMGSFPTTDLPGGRVSARVVKPSGPVKGKIVYLKETLFFSNLKKTVKKLAKKGAVGFIVEADLSPLYSKGLPYALRAHSTSWHYNQIPGLVVADARELIGQEVTLTNQARIVPGRGWNVVAKSPGEYQDYVLVSGHLDSWFQGALDDGSGSAAVIELARLLEPRPSGPTGVILLLADSEEIGLIGSADFIRKFGADRIKAMVELDMVSRKNDYSKKGPAQAKITPRLISTVPATKPFTRQAFADAPGKNYILPVSVSRGIYGGLGTDLEWFHTAGVPGVFIWTPSKFYHTVKDDLEYMDAADLQAVVKSTAELVNKLREEPVLRRVPNQVDLNFAAEVQADGKIGLAVNLPQVPLRAKVKVFVFYEFGLEKELDLKKDKEGVWRAEYSPAYTGAYQCLASITAGKKFGKKWLMIEAQALKL